MRVYTLDNTKDKKSVHKRTYSNPLFTASFEGYGKYIYLNSVTHQKFNHQDLHSFFCSKRYMQYIQKSVQKSLPSSTSLFKLAS